MSRPAAPPRRTKGILGGRSDEVVRQVLDAAIVELASSGYARFRMDEVAVRAGVNRTTIYRRWPNRLALVTAVVDGLRTPLRHNPLPDSGALEPESHRGVRAAMEVRTEGRGESLGTAARRAIQPGGRDDRGAAVAERSAEWKNMVTRAIERRELPAGTDEQLLLDFVHAIVDSRRAQPLDAKWLSAAVRTVVAGAGAGTLVRAGGKRAVARRGRRLG